MDLGIPAVRADTSGASTGASGTRRTDLKSPGVTGFGSSAET